MRKILIGFVVLIALVAGGIGWYQHEYYSGTTYYTKITTTGTKIAPQDNKGNVYIDFRYNQAAYDDAGHCKTLVFNGNKSRPLRMHAYLKLVYNRHRGVTSWQAVDQAQVPKRAKHLLN